MNKKHARVGMLLAAATLMPGLAHAQAAGDNVITLGWLHIAPMQSSTPLAIGIGPQPVDTALRLSNFTASGTSLNVSKTDTVGLTASHFLTDHWAATVIGGIPPLVSISGQGSVVPPGPANAMAKLDIGDPAMNPIIKSVRAWTPVALLQYHFGQPTARFRPFVGAGISYAWFSDIQLSNNMITGVRNALGGPLAAVAGMPGQSQVQAKASASWNPVVNAGLNYQITGHFGLTASLTYMPLRTNATLYIRSASNQVLATAKSRLTIDPLIPYLGVSYKF